MIDRTKRYITNASRAHGFTLMARTNPAEQGASGTSAFMGPRDAPEITLGTPGFLPTTRSITLG